MLYCPNCGQPVSGTAFCGNCGTPLGQEPSTEVAAHPAPTDTAPTGTAPSLDLSWLTRGNWVGAALTALTAVLVSFVVSGVLVWLADVDDQSVDDKLTSTAIATTAVATTDATASASHPDEEGEVDLGATVGTVPIFVALLGLGAAAVLFRRLTATYPSWRFALGDALRAAVVYGILLLLLAIVFRGSNDDLSRELQSELEVDGEGDLGYGASVPTSLLLGILVMFVVLALACFLRRDWLGDRAKRTHGLLAAPLTGLAGFLVLLPVAGAIGYACLWLTGEDVSGPSETNGDLGTGQKLSFWLFTIGNAGLGFLGLGGGARLGASYDVAFPEASDNESGEEFERLSWVVDESGAWAMWFAIPTLILVLSVTAYLVLQRAHRLGYRPLHNLGVWMALMFVTVPLLARLASVHATGELEYSVDPEVAAEQGLDENRVTVHADLFAGLPSGDALLIPLVGVLVGLAVAAATGALDVRRVASQLQQTPDGDRGTRGSA